jgi:hypothetical protein
MMREETFRKAIGDWRQPLPHPRFAVFRNNVAAALAAALRVRFPVIERLVGREFFAAMAHAYAGEQRPQSPVLIGYGGSFPDFIAGFPPAAGVAYLADVARLESAWWRAYHAADASPLQAQDFAAVPPEDWAGARLIIHPSAELYSSPWAAVSIWHAHHGGRPMAEINVEEAEWALVCRPFADVELRRIAPASHCFLGHLMAGLALADAAERAAASYPGFDPAAQTGALASLNIITGLQT